MAGDKIAYVLNSTGETISKINLTTEVVTNNIVTIGSDIYSFPNQIIVRDTLAFVIASGTDELQLINLNTEATVNFINTGAFSNPYWMAFYDSQYVYVTLMLQNKVIKVDVINGTIVDEINTGVSPAGLAIYNNKLYVVCSGYDFDSYTYNPSALAIYDLSDNSMIETLDIGLNAQYIAVDQVGNLHIVATGNYFDVEGEVYIVDGTTDQIIDNFPVGGPPGQIAIGSDNVAYIAAAGWSLNGYIYSYNTLTGEVYHDNGNPLEIDLNCLAAIPTDDSTILTASFGSDYINIIDSSGTRLADYPVGDGPVHLDINYRPGDVNGDYKIDILDVVYLINWKYKGGPKTWPARWRGNVNGDFEYNILDIVYLLNSIYKGGPAPKAGAPWVL